MWDHVTETLDASSIPIKMAIGIVTACFGQTIGMNVPQLYIEMGYKMMQLCNDYDTYPKKDYASTTIFKNDTNQF